MQRLVTLLHAAVAFVYRSAHWKKKAFALRCSGMRAAAKLATLFLVSHGRVTFAEFFYDLLSTDARK